MFLISFAYADAAAASTPNPFMQFIPLVGVMIVLYFFMIRPQNKKAQEQKKMIDALTKGTSVITNSGLIGVISKIEENEMTLEIAPDVTVRMLRSAVLSVYDGKLKLAKSPVQKEKPGKSTKKNSNEVESSESKVS